MIVLVDCNSFFCFVEKVFYFGLNGKFVCVFFCNDSCIVVLILEVKVLGLCCGDFIFKKKGIVQYYGVKLFFMNMYFYVVMFKWVNNILWFVVFYLEIYLIDEFFFYLDGLEKYYNLEDYMSGVVEKIRFYMEVWVLY